MERLDPGLKQWSSQSLSESCCHIGSLPTSEPITAAAEELRADWPELYCGGGASTEPLGPGMPEACLRSDASGYNRADIHREEFTKQR